MQHSRWLTTANLVLRPYVLPTEEISNDIVLYVMKFYVPIWFTIKRNGVVFKTIQYSLSLEDSDGAIIVPVIRRNVFLAHPVSILLAMIQDEKKSVRELGW